jgi:hypothetical protein
MGIISASTARDRVTALKQLRADTEQELIASKIEDAINAEQFTVTLPQRLSEMVTNRLRMNGYKVTFSSSRNEPQTVISWREEDA